MSNKDRPQVERHPPKKGVGWLVNAQQGKVCSFTNDSPTAHAQWVVVETRPLRGAGQPVVRRMLRHKAIEAWNRCRRQAVGSVARLGCDYCNRNQAKPFIMCGLTPDPCSVPCACRYR